MVKKGSLLDRATAQKVANFVLNQQTRKKKRGSLRLPLLIGMNEKYNKKVFSYLQHRQAVGDNQPNLSVFGFCT